MITTLDASWPATKAWLESRIEGLRLQLEAPGVTHDDSNVLRGSIAAHREMIKAVESPPRPAAGGRGTNYQNK